MQARVLNAYNLRDYLYRRHLATGFEKNCSFVPCFSSPPSVLPRSVVAVFSGSSIRIFLPVLVIVGSADGSVGGGG